MENNLAWEWEKDLGHIKGRAGKYTISTYTNMSELLYKGETVMQVFIPFKREDETILLCKYALEHKQLNFEE
jgi:hypothetical protein